MCGRLTNYQDGKVLGWDLVGPMASDISRAMSFEVRQSDIIGNVNMIIEAGTNDETDTDTNQQNIGLTQL